MTRRDLDHVIAARARAQHGVFSREQALRAGLSPTAVTRRVHSGAWLRLDSGVYALPGNPATWHRQCMAATLGEREAVVSGRAAASLHGFPGFRPGRVQITVPTASNHTSRLAVVRQSDLFERTRVLGIPVTTVPQTLIEIARYLDDTRYDGLVSELVTEDPRVLTALQERYVDLARSRWPGIARVRLALDARGDGYVPPDSVLEEALWKALRKVPDLEDFVAQSPLPWRPAAQQRVDVLLPRLKLIIEADGRRWHTRVADFERDHERDAEAIAHGYRTLRFTWHQLVHRGVWVHEILERVDDLALAA